MTNDLDQKQRAWLERQVEAGNLPSVEDGVRVAVADMMAIAEDSLAWAAPYVAKARESVARGDVVPASAVIAELEQRART